MRRTDRRSLSVMLGVCSGVVLLAVVPLPAGYKDEGRSRGMPAIGVQAGASRLQTERITVRPYGFDPQRINRPVGPFLLAIDDRSGLNQLTLYIERSLGNKLKDIQILRRRPEYREIIDLSYGDYSLKETNHPAWVCVITISRK